MRTKVSGRTRKMGQGDRMMRQYLKEISGIPLLTADEEKELARLAQNGDLQARQKLTESNLRFVIKIAKRYARKPGQLLELINVGNVGLIIAAGRFDPEKNVRFTTYAIWWIRQAIFHHLAQLTYAFRVPPKTANIIYHLQRATKTKAELPDLMEVSENLGIPRETLNDAMMIIAGTLSLSDPTTDDGDLTLEDRVAQKVFASPQEHTFHWGLHRDLDRCLRRLPLIEQNVIRWRFGINDQRPKTLREIGERLNLSRERVRQIENGAIHKLQQFQAEHNLSTYLA